MRQLSSIGSGMDRKLTLIYWKHDGFWLGKLLEHSEIMTQGETLRELEGNIKDAFRLMALDDVPENHRSKRLAVRCTRTR